MWGDGGVSLIRRVFYVMLLAIVVPLASVGIFYLYKMRTHPICRARLIRISIPASVVLIVVSIVFAVSEIVFKFPCSAIYIVSNVGLLGFVFICYLLRAFVLWYKIGLVGERLAVWASSKRLQKTSTFFSDHQYLISPRFILSATGIVVLVVLSLTIAQILLEGSVTRAVEEGKNCPDSVAQYIVVGLAFLLVLVVLSFAYRLRNGKENFGIKEELAMVGIVAVISFPAFGLTLALTDISKFRLHIIVLTVGCSLSALISIWHPVLMVRKETSNAFTRLDETGIARSERITSLSKRNRVADLRDEFMMVMHDRECFEAFKDYLLKEFSVENALFWEDCVVLENMVDTNSPSDAIIDTTMALYNSFLSPDAPNPVNVSYNVKNDVQQKLSARPRKEDALNMPLVFAQARDELEKLMMNDSYRRFKFSTDFSPVKARLKEMAQADLKRRSVMKEIDNLELFSDASSKPKTNPAKKEDEIV